MLLGAAGASGVSKPIHTALPDLQALAERHHQPLLRHVRGKVANIGDAEDIAQEVWLRAAGPAPARSGAIGNVRAWLYRVAANLVVDHHRRAARRAEVAVADEALAAVPDPRPDPELALLTRDELRRIAAILQAMPERPREVFRLRRVEGLSFADIGRRLGITRQTVHDHMLRALVVLQLAANDEIDPGT